MIQQDPALSIRRQCELLAVSRSGWYYEPVGTSTEDLELMRRIDALHLEYPFLGSRQMREAKTIGATRPCWSKGRGGCDASLKLREVVQWVRNPPGEG